MNLNVRSQNCHFPFTSLPTLVVYHIAQYLKRRDLENMAQVNRHLRNVFNTPRLWRDVQIRILGMKTDPQSLRIPGKKPDPQSLQILKVRGVTDLEFRNVRFDLPVATLHHCLERLSLHVTRSSTLEVLFNAASNGHLCNLKSLAFGDLDYKIGHKSRVTFLSLFKSLPMMQEVSFGRDDSPARFFNRENYVPLTDETEMGVDLQQALCYTGKLTSISLICFEKVGRSWLNTVMINNPHMQSLSLYHTQHFAEEGLDDSADPTTCSSLRTFKLGVPSLNGPSSYSKAANKVLSWAFPGNKPNENVTTLELSNSYVSWESAIFPLDDKFPALKKLSLTDSVTVGNFSYFSLQSFPNFQNLEWLEIKHPTIKGNELLFLAEKVGKALRYLSLPRQHLIKDCHLRDLAHLFPALRTLDLSQCAYITDAILVEWYIKHDKSELWPKLRKLVLKDCRGITQDVINSVRLKTRNQLLIDF